MAAKSSLPKPATCAAGSLMPCAWPRPLCIAATPRWVTIFAVFARDSVPPRPSLLPLTNSLASFSPCYAIAALSTLNSWEPSTKNIFAAVKTPCANTPLLSALNLFLSKILPVQFLRRDYAKLFGRIIQAASCNSATRQSSLLMNLHTATASDAQRPWSAAPRSQPRRVAALAAPLG